MDLSPTLALEAYTRQDPAPIILELQRVVFENHSWITDHKKYSKTLASYIIETELRYVRKLAEDIASLDVKVFPENFNIEIAELQEHIRSEETEIVLALTIHFIQNQLDFRETGV